MKILFVSPEVVPFAKTGGLADVAGALPKAIKELGHDIRIILPKYLMVDEKKFKLKSTGISFDLKVGSSTDKAEIFEASIPGTDVIVYFVSCDKYFARKELYTEKGQDYPDNAERYIFFSKAVLEFLKLKEWQPDVIHLNDWQTSMIAAYIKTQKDPFYARTCTVYSIHNMAYNGAFPKEKFEATGLAWTFFEDGRMSEWDQFVLAKVGFSFADVVSTVSETYSKEIQTQEFGYGLEHAAKARSKDMYGILNGVDYSLWDPSKDKHIVRRYSQATISLKDPNKAELQKKYNLPVSESIPLLGIVTRLCDQKGIDLLCEIVDDIANFGAQIVVLGTGEPKYHDMLTNSKKKAPDKVGLKLGFDAALAQLIYAGCDMFLMPSKYEPCGLGQLISFKYGTIPIVRKTGGLADTVQDINVESGDGNGFVFEQYSSYAFLESVKKAIEAYKHKPLLNAVKRRIMGYDYSWQSSAKKYISLYMKALDKIRK